MLTIPKAMRHLYRRRLSSIYDGNISHKKKGSNSFIITPGSLRKHCLDDEDMVQVNVADDLHWDEGVSPSREVMLHYYTLFDTKDDLYVVHCHPPNVLRFIRDNEFRDIKALFPELEYKIGDDVEYYSAGTDRLAKEVYENLRGNDIVALHKHGIVAKGDDLQKVVDMVEVLDFYCAI